MSPTVAFLLAVLSGLAVFLLAGLVLARPAITLLTTAFTKRLMKDPYPENIFEMYNVFAKVGVPNVIEGNLRSNTGEPLRRPFGTPRRPSRWDQLVFGPVYLSRNPVAESVEIDTRVTLGPQARRPVSIDIPILISGMAYGTGLAKNAKLALARGADLANTATNTGSGAFLPEERVEAKRLIVQYHRGSWGQNEAVLRQADAIEIQLGYGALAAAPVTWKYDDLSPDFRDYMKLKPGEDLHETSVLKGAENGRALERMVKYLRDLSGGVPIGVKFGATQRLEQEMAIMAEAGVDFIHIAGSEAGIHYSPAILADDTGLPTLPALCRASAFLEIMGHRSRVTLIVSGGLVTPGQFLKALALGADAVAIGTAALLAVAHAQITKVLPFEPISQLLYETGNKKNSLSIEDGSRGLSNFLKSCKEEIDICIRTLGRARLKEVTPDDMCALSHEMARLTGAPLGIVPPERLKGQ